MLRQYPALVHKERKSDYGVSFPDFPGCVTAGSTPDEAYELAAEALQLHVDGMIEDGDAIPPASSLAAVVQRVPELGALVALMVPVQLPGRAKRVDVTLDENLLAEVDRVASERGMSRSGLLAEGARRVLHEVRPPRAAAGAKRPADTQPPRSKQGRRPKRRAAG